MLRIYRFLPPVSCQSILHLGHVLEANVGSSDELIKQISSRDPRPHPAPRHYPPHFSRQSPRPARHPPRPRSNASSPRYDDRWCGNRLSRPVCQPRRSSALQPAYIPAPFSASGVQVRCCKFCGRIFSRSISIRGGEKEVSVDVCFSAARICVYRVPAANFR